VGCEKFPALTLLSSNQGCGSAIEINLHNGSSLTAANLEPPAKASSRSASNLPSLGSTAHAKTNNQHHSSNNIDVVSDLASSEG